MRGEKVKVGKSRTLAREGDQSESKEREGWTPRLTKANSKEERQGKQEEPP